MPAAAFPWPSYISRNVERWALASIVKLVETGVSPSLALPNKGLVVVVLDS